MSALDAQRFSVIVCQKISLERRVSEHKAVIARQSAVIAKHPYDLSRLAFQVLDKHGRLERRVSRLEAALREIRDTLLAHDPDMALAMKHEAEGEYQRGYLEAFQIIDEMRIDEQANND